MFTLRALPVALTLLVAVSAAAQEVHYSFEFDLRRDNQHALALDYRYQAGSRVLVAAPVREVERGRPFGSLSYGARMPPGTSLYVKWRDTDTNDVFEETANLEGRLPKDLKGCTVVFMIVDNHLHVYVAEEKPRESNTAPVGPRLYRDDHITQIYPS